MNKHAAIPLLGLLLTPLALPAQLQQPNLPATPTANRFTITDRVWPANPGEASLCLWDDDKLAALTFTVDDNCRPDIPWWLDQSAAYGIPVTWFVITERIDGPNAGFNGTWAEYGSLLDLGHDIQSHTVLHLHTEDPLWTGIEAEYRDSKIAIETNIANHTADFLAYPGGANSYLNDRTIAANYYAAARGGSGRINQANRIDYFAINGMTSFSIGGTAAWSNLNNLFNAADLRYYRGWAVLVYHKINDYSTVQPVLDFTETHRADLWLGAFGDVAKYGQQRDTATLAVTSSTASAITLTLSDQMDDVRFDHPLTVKVRLPSAWSTVAATQNNLPVESRLVVHGGNPYALVRAIPDRGEVRLSAASTPPLAYEGFGYAATANIGTAPDSTADFGWTGTTWTGANDVIAPGLAHASVPSASGNALQISANVGSVRSFDLSAFPATHTQLDPDSVTRLGKPGSTLWLRFLVRADATDATGSLTTGLNLNGAGTGGTTKLRIGDTGTGLNWSLLRGTTTAASSTPITVGDTVCLVVRIQFVAGSNNDQVDLFINPATGATPPATADATLTGLDIGTFDRVELKGNRTSTLDEISFAPAWSDL